MLEEQVGLTKLYNALKDASMTDKRIAHIRTLHEQLDAAVLTAYGWQDLPVPPYCAGTRVSVEEDSAAQKAFADAVIDRLYALNGVRAKGTKSAEGAKVKRVKKSAK
jgi:hypothetical protein